MIPRKQAGNQIRTHFTDPLELLDFLDLSPEQVSYSHPAQQQFQFKVPISWAKQIQPGDANDPLLLQILPTQSETEATPGFSKDPLEEAAFLQQPGLLQKYHGRALLLITPVCSIHCRYCFRRHFPYDDKGHFWQQVEKNIDTIRQDSSINEIILSGGDPLSLSDEKLAGLVKQIETIAHISRLRIHTRTPVVAPQRVTQALLNIFKCSQLSIIMVLHCNHAAEFQAEHQQTFRNLILSNVSLFNQSVLLKGINDTVASLVQLSETLMTHAIVPYYLHLLDKVAGSAHFEVSEAQALALYEQLRDRLPGYMLPKLVREIPGKNSKTAVYVP
jgi:EF-P beta-lysylation protein EpmB